MYLTNLDLKRVFYTRNTYNNRSSSHQSSTSSRTLISVDLLTTKITTTTTIKNIQKPPNFIANKRSKCEYAFQITVREVDSFFSSHSFFFTLATVNWRRLNRRGPDTHRYACTWGAHKIMRNK